MDDKFLAEFRGLFFGEGCADIQRYSRKFSKQPLYRPRLRISLRRDDEAILLAIQSEVGGIITRHDGNEKTKPFTLWSAVSHSDVRRICPLLLDSPALPSKKIQQLRLVLDAVSFRNGRNGKMFKSERDHLEELYQQLQTLKRFDF